MSEPASRGDLPIINTLYHPTFLTESREEVAKFFERVFGVKSTFQRTYTSSPALKYDEAYPLDYSLYTWIADLWFDAIDPRLYNFHMSDPTRSLNRLSELAWLMRDPAAALAACLKAGIRVYSQAGEEVREVSQATSEAMPGIHWLVTEPADAGMTMLLLMMDQPLGDVFGEAFEDPRLIQHYTPPEYESAGPLTVVRTAHHTILTDDLERARRFVRAMGGSEFKQTHNAALNTDSTWFDLNGVVLEYTVPLDDSSQAMAEFRRKPFGLSGLEQKDVYHSVTFEVADLAAARNHLAQCGVGLEADTEHLVLADPQDCLGMRWGFTDQPNRAA